MCLRKKILYQYFVFFGLLGTASLVVFVVLETTSALKTCYMPLHSTKNIRKI